MRSKPDIKNIYKQCHYSSNDSGVKTNLYPDLSLAVTGSIDSESGGHRDCSCYDPDYCTCYRITEASVQSIDYEILFGYNNDYSWLCGVNNTTATQKSMLTIIKELDSLKDCFIAFGAIDYYGESLAIKPANKEVIKTIHNIHDSIINEDWNTFFLLLLDLHGVDTTNKFVVDISSNPRTKPNLMKSELIKRLTLKVKLNQDIVTLIDGPVGNIEWTITLT